MPVPKKVARLGTSERRLHRDVGGNNSARREPNLASRALSPSRPSLRSTSTTTSPAPVLMPTFWRESPRRSTTGLPLFCLPQSFQPGGSGTSFRDCHHAGSKGKLLPTLDRRNLRPVSKLGDVREANAEPRTLAFEATADDLRATGDNVGLDVRVGRRHVGQRLLDNGDSAAREDLEPALMESGRDVLTVVAGARKPTRKGREYADHAPPPRWRPARRPLPPLVHVASSISIRVAHGARLL